MNPFYLERRFAFANALRHFVAVAWRYYFEHQGSRNAVQVQKRWMLDMISNSCTCTVITWMPRSHSQPVFIPLRCWYESSNHFAIARSIVKDQDILRILWLYRTMVRMESTSNASRKLIMMTMKKIAGDHRSSPAFHMDFFQKSNRDISWNRFPFKRDFAQQIFTPRRYSRNNDYSHQDRTNACEVSKVEEIRVKYGEGRGCEIQRSQWRRRRLKNHCKIYKNT